FQAEDGIRDWSVTGVQTCALPISQLVRGGAAPGVEAPPVLSVPANQVDAETRDLCAKSARRAGVPLDDLMLAQLLEGAPYALERSGERRGGEEGRGQGAPGQGKRG